MPNVLIADGTPTVWQAERAGFGIPSSFSLFAAAVQLHHPDLRATPLNIADGEAFALWYSAFGLRRRDDPWLTSPYL